MIFSRAAVALAVTGSACHMGARPPIEVHTVPAAPQSSFVAPTASVWCADIQKCAPWARDCQRSKNDCLAFIAVNRKDHDFSLCPTPTCTQTNRFWCTRFKPYDHPTTVVEVCYGSSDDCFAEWTGRMGADEVVESCKAHP